MPRVAPQVFILLLAALVFQILAVCAAPFPLPHTEGDHDYYSTTEIGEATDVATLPVETTIASDPAPTKTPSITLTATTVSSTTSTSKTATPSATTPVTDDGPKSGSVIATGWYPSWLGETLPPEQISWSKYTGLTFAFAITTPDPSVISLDEQSAELLPRFVAAAHENRAHASLSIGGWTGSIYFSSAVDSAENRTAFVKAVTGLVEKYNLDGVDFDWEYPNRQGIGCNLISADDSKNFLSFLQELREDPVGSNITLSAAVGITPFVGADGQPMQDVSAFADVLDHIAIMNYDIWGSWSNSVGPNAPLDDTCAAEGEKVGSAVSAIKAWTGAGFPASQITLGVAAYGHSFYVEQSVAKQDGTISLYPTFDKEKQPLGDSDDPTTIPSVDQCGNQITLPGGTFNFKGMIEKGFLGPDGWPAPGIDYRFDECSQTPFVYNGQTGVYISYDDPKSFAAKGKFINENGLAGFSMWHIAGDQDDILVNAISDSMELVELCAPESSS